MPTVNISWRTPKSEVRQSSIHGRGLFATAAIKKDEIVMIKGGHIIAREQLVDLNARLGSVEVQISDDLFIAPVTEEEREGSMLYSNHSCDANLGVRGNIVFVAMRDISAGEELTHDWCTTDDDNYSVECKCGSVNCRKILTGKDWQKPELQKKYAGYFSWYLQRKMDARLRPTNPSSLSEVEGSRGSHLKSSAAGSLDFTRDDGEIQPRASSGNVPTYKVLLTELPGNQLEF